MKFEINKIKNVLSIWKINKRWKLIACRIIDKGYDADKLHTVLDDCMIDKIVKTSPANTYKHYQVGKVVQIRRNASIDNTDLVLLRLPNGILIPFSSCAFFKLDNNDNEVFEKLYERIYMYSPELEHSQRWFTYLEDGNINKYIGSVVNYKENTAKELLNNISIITQNLQNKFITNFY